MRLGALIDGLGEAVRDLEVTGIATDSRAVRPGEAFFALPGLRTDGRRHVAEAHAPSSPRAQVMSRWRARVASPSCP